MLGYATSAGAYAFSTASSYVFRPDASTSSIPDDDLSVNGGSNSKGSDSHNNRSSGKERVNGTRSSRNGGMNGTGSRSDKGSSSSSSTRAQDQMARRSQQHRRNDSKLPSASNSINDNSMNGGGSMEESSDKRQGKLLVDQINLEDNLYKILGLNKKCKTEEIRRAFLMKSRLCHPDKLPDYEPATPAFQRLSYAYETLSKPASRRIYDLSDGRSSSHPGPPRGDAAGMNADETLNGVLRNVFNEFLNGDFEMIRVFVNALNDGNPGLNLGEEAVDNLEGAFRKVREVLLGGQKYMRIIKFELIRLYEIQHSLRSLGYFDLVGRFRLTLALTRVTLEIPMVLDRAMRDEVPSVVPQGLGPAGNAEGDEDVDDPENGESKKGKANKGKEQTPGELQRRGLLGPRVKGVLVLACKVLEKGEKFGT